MEDKKKPVGTGEEKKRESAPPVAAVLKRQKSSHGLPKGQIIIQPEGLKEGPPTEGKSTKKGKNMARERP